MRCVLNGGSYNEKPHYLCELLLRLKQGSLFHGQFVYQANQHWYEADCVVTNVALNFAPGEVVQSRVEFVTTGPVDLHTGEPDGYTLQEDLTDPARTIQESC